MKQILLIDKDETLGEGKDSFRLYEGAVGFLKDQAVKRDIYAATTAQKARCEEHLAPVIGLFKGILGKEDIDGGPSQYYMEGGVLRRVAEEYVEANPRQTVHRVNGSVLSWDLRYRNPNLDGGSFQKDLYIARLLIAQKVQEDLSCVMVGDSLDALFGDSDPSTPVIAVSQRVRQGDWSLVERPLEVLFKGPEKPHEIYDTLFRSVGGGTVRQVTIQGQTYDFTRESENSGRVIKCK